MMKNGNGSRCGITRRGLLAGAGACLLSGASGAYVARKLLFPPDQGVQPIVASTATQFGMPGPFPGRVSEVRHEGAVTDRNEVDADVVSEMMARGMCDLTGADHPQEAWRRFFCADDVVGIKVNPVGKRRGNAVECISNPAVLVEIVRGLKSAGVRTQNIIVFERYANEFRDAGYERLLRSRPLEGISWCASSTAYTETQLAIDGHDNGGRDPNVIGYDPDVFVDMGFAHPQHDRQDDRKTRSHLSAIITRLVNKFITIPCLKDHRSAGVTLALKNMSHGLNNNVSRSHLAGLYQPAGGRSGPNQCNTFIPRAVNQEIIRQKATLHIMDGLIGVYEGGPGSWNRTWATWRRNSLFFATDPVAMDRVCWDIIDKRRLLEGWLPVAQMGMLNSPPVRACSTRQACSSLGGPMSAAAMLAQQPQLTAERNTEAFDRRQPEHVILAGTLGLGEYDPRNIEHSYRNMNSRNSP